jgi:hypothetical protein
MFVARAASEVRAAGRGPPSPVLLELYQSQGCSSCPPALEVLREEADRANVIALNFAVTYWDQLGWKDSFAQPAFTRRQWDYARANGRGNVATPQLIVNGRGFVNGGSRAEVDQAIRRFGSVPAGPAMELHGGRLQISGTGANIPATVWLVSYDPRTISVPIRAGENEGRTLPHRNIVRDLRLLGRWKRGRASFGLPAPRAELARVIIVQAGPGGPILGARAVG